MITSEPLSDTNLDETTTVMLDSFLALNPSWKNYGYPFKQLLPYVRTKVQSTISGKQSLVFRRDGKVIAGIIANDIVEAESTLSLPFDLPLFDRSKVTGKYLNKYLPMTDIKSGEAIYIFSVFVDHRLASKALFARVFVEYMCKSQEKGYQKWYSLASNPRFTQVTISLGADLMAQIKQDSTELAFLGLAYSRVDLSALKSKFGMLQTYQRPSL